MCAIVLAVGTPAPAASAIRVIADDAELALTPAPTMVGGVLYLPLRSLAHHFLAKVAFTSQGAISLTRVDDTVLILRPDRMEVLAGNLVQALLDAPVRLMNGTTFVPASAVDALFPALTQWDPAGQTLVITTHTSFHAEAAPRAVGTPVPATVATPAPFTPEFVPDTQKPVVASGYVTVGVGIGGTSGSTANAQAQFTTNGGTERVGGMVSVAAANGTVQAAGTVTVRDPQTILTVGALTLDDSPLTLYQQGLTGVLDENVVGPEPVTYFGGTLAPLGGASVFGMSTQLPPSGRWTYDSGLLYAPLTGGVIVKNRANYSLNDGLSAFGEVGLGTSGGATGLGWRTGVTGDSGNLTPSLSYVSMPASYPAIGNASVFAGYNGPLLEINYRPSPEWSLLASAAALTAPGLPPRATYGLLANYQASSTVGVALQLLNTEDSSPSIHTQTTTAAAGVSWTSGRWGAAASVNQLNTADLLAGISTTTASWSLRAGYTLENGRPVWTELAQSTGATQYWSAALGWTFPTAESFDLATTVRYKASTLPTASTESALEIGVVQPLAGGAQLLAGIGVKYTMPAAVTTPYLTFQYGYPFAMYGTPQVGQVTAMVYADLDGTGVRDPNATGFPGVTVRIGGLSAAQTDRAGRVVVDGVHEGQYVVSIDETTVPTGFVAARPKVEVVVATGGTTAVAFPVVPAATIRGVAFFDENGDGQFSSSKQGVEGLVLTLKPRGDIRTSDSQGAFEFDHLLPGEYMLVVDPTALPPDMKVANGGVFALTLQPGGTTIVQIPLISAKPIIKKTFP